MNIKHYNRLYHIHTISGIVISVALFVIFFTGSFSFFRDEIVNWERGHSLQVVDEIGMDADTVLATLAKTYDLYGRDVNLRHYYNERRIAVSLSGTRDSTAVEKNKAGAFFYMDTENRSTDSYGETYTLGEFIYRLHFFAPIPYPAGYYLSGFVAFFFLFAIITGIIIHWDKLVTHFFVFRPWAKWKTVWTDAHTTLGVIGFPFQLVYALTGAFFMLKGLIVAPFVFALYQGDDEKFYQDLEYRTPLPAMVYEKMETLPSLSALVRQTTDRWPGFKVTDLDMTNFGDREMHLTVSGHLSRAGKFNGSGKIIYRVADQRIVYERNPVTNSSYLDGVKNVLYRLHFGDYAGMGLRVISFILGLISCFVILSGVMIWLTARDKPNVPPSRRRSNQTVGFVFMAICLSLYPMIAMAFIMVKLFPAAGMSFIYQTFFIGWLFTSLVLISQKNNHTSLHWSLLLATMSGLAIPIINGVVTGHWFWEGGIDLQTEPYQFVDLFWLLLSTINCYALYRLRIISRLSKKSNDENFPWKKGRVKRPSKDTVSLHD